MIKYESDEYSIRNKRSEYIGNYATHHKIRIDDKKPIESVAKNIDRIIQLHRSNMWGKFDELMDRVMVKYYKLSDEGKIRELPEEAKDDIKQVFKDYKRQSDHYKARKSDEHAKKPQLINDENDKTTTVIDTDYFKATTNVKIDFPYQSIGEIFRDKKLSTSEKSAMIDKYREAKSGKTENILDMGTPESNEEIETKEESEMLDILIYGGHPEDFIKDEVPIDEVEEATELQYEKTTTPPKNYFKILCAKYPEKFILAKRGSKGKVGWFKTYRKETYTPTLITLNPAESKDYELECLRDSTVKYMPDAYFVKKLNCYIYFVRTTK